MESVVFFSPNLRRPPSPTIPTAFSLFDGIGIEGTSASPLRALHPSPNMATASSPWMAPAQPHPPASQPAGSDELTMQSRPMGLKVHYSFDRDNQVHCLARWPHILQIQTVPLDEKTTIGVVDLRTCLQAVAQSSPELLNQQENDYSVYAYDYSEPDVPLVGQGMLSWAMDPQRGAQQQQLVTGRVTRNLLALLNSGSRDTLEVKLKFAAVSRMPIRSDCPPAEPTSAPRIAPISNETASEWNSFLQSNPMMGHTGNTSTVSSPALPPAQLSQYATSSFVENRPVEMRSEGYPPQQPSLSQQQQPPPPRPGSIPPPNSFPPVPIAPASRAGSVAPIPPRPQSSASNAPIAAGPSARPTPEPAPQPRSSRPGSRSRSKQPTGRPRGRPRKRPVETGNTSAVEEATDADEAAPPKKRAMVTRTEYSPIAPFGAAPESLRVAASTSGSLRTMRPVGAGVEGPAANHLQDVPRAPTPIPDRQLLPRKRAVDLSRTESMMSMDQSIASTPPMVQNLAQDARSPAPSNAQSPDHGYSPEDSTGDLNSSPPVPRTAAYLRSSPPASSPTLPTLSMPPLDSGFMSGGLEDMFDDEDLLQGLSRDTTQEQSLPAPSPPVLTKPSACKNARRQQRATFPFHEVNPGPPELLPTKSIYNPTGKLKALSRQASVTTPQSMLEKPPTRPLTGSDAAPTPAMSEPELTPYHQETPAYDQSQSQSQPQPQVTPGPDASLESAASQNVPPPAPEPLQTAPQNGHAEPSAQQPLPVPARPLPIPQRPEPEPALQCDGLPAAGPSSRPASQGRPTSGAAMPTAPAREPATESLLTLPQIPATEPPCPPSDPDPPRYSKNFVKKQSIKEKLQSAIEKGDPPPFCSNCGAIETPTWRKIWTQDHEGVPGFHEFSDKPGCVTMIEVLERDENEQPSRYRMVKKNLGPMDDKKKWIETLLCNPCGIWLGKFKVHRPPDRWDKDAARLNQPRKKKAGNSKSKKSRAKSEAPPNPTSEAYLTTDPFGPLDSDLPTGNGMQMPPQGPVQTEANPLNFQSSPRQRLLGSTHSRGSGTADSPVRVDDELGTTRRLLFPSPRRDGVPKTLGELHFNSTPTPAAPQDGAKQARGKENDAHPERPGTPVADDLEQELFGTPPKRPSTPPPKPAVHPFKTPTRPTPSHRPITRSISRSIRSGMPNKSPSQLLAAHLLQQTPTKTPRSASGQYLHPGSASKRRTPRHSGGGGGGHDGHFMDASDPNHLMMHFDSPFTATLNQLLSEANDFIGGSPSRQVHGHDGLDLSGLDMDREFGNFLSTDLVMPSSPPVVRGGSGSGRGRGKRLGAEQFGGALEQQQQQGQQHEDEEEMWARHLAGNVEEKERRI
ncbi:hypothetical protein VTJ83DRAFT_5866 [Remersonia thermophila]|uniref:Ams2/SPT21 N-terminal domain-containing protein n=1 Tax=Remersonia thermophila TaxID=72144 RepID=A0ABR4D828_9PEZI